MNGVFLKSLVLAICSTLSAIPYFYHLIFLAPIKNPFLLSLGLRGSLFVELLILFILSLLSGIVGFSYSEKRGLVGFGDKIGFIRSIPLLLLLGVIMIALSYLLFDRFFFEISPTSYPKDLLFLISIPFKGAFTEELILRFSLVTIVVGIFKDRVTGIVIASAIATLFTLKYLQIVGISFCLNHLIVAGLLLSFSANLILGYLFAYRGLLYAMAFNFILGMKYAVVSWTM
ncbi:MAG: hypothetical protein JRI52_00460 [Deltaproteobacteria bacterium]|nr:hypothetical protein [Deltaproteobacteria bacterium]